MNQEKTKNGKESPSIHIEKSGTSGLETQKTAKKKLITAIIPLRGRSDQSIDYNETLIRKCLESLKESRKINQIVISADDEELLKLAGRFTEFIPVLRPKNLSEPGVRVHEVLQYTLQQLSDRDVHPDLLVPVEITYPFRPPGLFDKLIDMLYEGRYNTVIAGVPEYRVCWRESEGGFESITELTVARPERTPLYIGLPSLGCAIYPDLVRAGKRYGDKLGIYQVDEPFATVEIRTPKQLEKIAKQLYWPAS